MLLPNACLTLLASGKTRQTTDSSQWFVYCDMQSQQLPAGQLPQQGGEVIKAMFYLWLLSLGCYGEKQARALAAARSTHHAKTNHGPKVCVCLATSTRNTRDQAPCINFHDQVERSSLPWCAVKQFSVYFYPSLNNHLLSVKQTVYVQQSIFKYYFWNLVPISCIKLILCQPLQFFRKKTFQISPPESPKTNMESLSLSGNCWGLQDGVGKSLINTTRIIFLGFYQLIP